MKILKANASSILGGFFFLVIFSNILFLFLFSLYTTPSVNIDGEQIAYIVWFVAIMLTLVFLLFKKVWKSVGIIFAFFANIGLWGIFFLLMFASLSELLDFLSGDNLFFYGGLPFPSALLALFSQ